MVFKRNLFIALQPLPNTNFKKMHYHAQGDALYSMELALSLEKLNFIKLRELHRVASNAEDAQLADYIGECFPRKVPLRAEVPGSTFLGLLPLGACFRQRSASSDCGSCSVSCKPDHLLAPAHGMRSEQSCHESLEGFLPCVESEFLQEQAQAIKTVSEYVSQLRRVGKGLGVFEFDRYLSGQLANGAGPAMGADLPAVA